MGNRGVGDGEGNEAKTGPPPTEREIVSVLGLFLLSIIPAALVGTWLVNHSKVLGIAIMLAPLAGFLGSMFRMERRRHRSVVATRPEEAKAEEEAAVLTAVSVTPALLLLFLAPVLGLAAYALLPIPGLYFGIRAVTAHRRGDVRRSFRLIRDGIISSLLMLFMMAYLSFVSEIPFEVDFFLQVVVIPTLFVASQAAAWLWRKLR